MTAAFDPSQVARHAASMLAERALRPPPWKPLPHQVPPPGDWYGWLLLAGRGAGKGLALDTPLPTPTGWTTMRDVQPGDELLDEQGQPCRVVSTSPVRQLDCYDLTLATGETLTCDGDHLWSIVTNYARQHYGTGSGGDWRDNWDVAKTLNVRELRKRSPQKWRIPLTRPLVGHDVSLPIDPYLLGAWLGDGDSRRLWIAISPTDHEIIDECARRSGWLIDRALWSYPGRNDLLGAKFRSTDEPGPTLLRRLNLFTNKHVPSAYLRASYETRLTVLRGIMDTDGHAHGRVDSTKSSQHASIAVKSERLARDVLELVMSLGGHGSLRRRIKKLNYREEPYVTWCVTFTLDENPFFLTRKRESYDVRPSKQPWRRIAHQVKSLTPTMSVPTRCITVDSPRSLYLAGRSMIPTHNTDACAHYVAEHVNGPPCLRGPTPHWVGIVAPTLGDAVTACYAGPSGIRVHSPDAKLRQSAGGTVITWSNGSEAKLFGASNPEDVERLRAGGNRSLVASTLVETEHGQQRIDEVTPGQRVWTRNGLRTVIAVHDNDVKPIWEVTTEGGHTLRVTADHKIWTGSEWRRVDELRSGSNVATCLPNSLPTTAFDGVSKSRVTTRTHDEDSFTATSGRDITDRFRQVYTSTTSTMTGKTTPLLTWSRSTQVNTHVVIPGETFRRVVDEPDLLRRRLHAAYAQRSNDHSVTASVVTVADGSTTRTLTLDTAMLTYTGVLELRNERAPNAQVHSSYRELAQRGNVVNIVDVSLSGDHAKIVPHTPIECAACAAHDFGETYDRRLELALETVRCVKPCVSVETGAATEERVYDLTVEHDHEFFANGILVANCLAWLEEVAAWRYLQACWEQVRFGLRSGPRPHWIGSTTPKPRPLIKKLAKTTPHNVVVTRAATDDNPHLLASVKAELYEDYGGQQIGRQELYAEVLEEDAAALWTREVLERTRVGVRGQPDVPEQFSRLTVGVDPSGGAGEQGIVVVGRASIEEVDERGRPKRHSEGFVLADKTVCLDPHGWSRAAVRAAIEYEADDIVVERNYGGAMATSTILDACDGLGVSIPVREVTASRGKRVRAEPVSALTNRNRWHLVGHLPELEDQMCTWTVESDYSPDRLDAMVWPAWHMGLVSVRVKGVGRLPMAEFAQTPIA